MYSSNSSQSASESAEAVPALNPNADLCDYAHPHPPPPPLRFFADYQVYFNRMIQSCNWEHTLLYFDGNHRVHTHGWYDSTQWHHHYAHLVYPLAANKQFYARAWNGCWNVWHTAGYYSHFYAMYVGAIPA